MGWDQAIAHVVAAVVMATEHVHQCHKISAFPDFEMDISPLFSFPRHFLHSLGLSFIPPVSISFSLCLTLLVAGFNTVAMEHLPQLVLK